MIWAILAAGAALFGFVAFEKMHGSSGSSGGVAITAKWDANMGAPNIAIMMNLIAELGNEPAAVDFITLVALAFQVGEAGKGPSPLAAQTMLSVANYGRAKLGIPSIQSIPYPMPTAPSPSPLFVQAALEGGTMVAPQQMLYDLTPAGTWSPSGPLTAAKELTIYQNPGSFS